MAAGPPHHPGPMRLAGSAVRAGNGPLGPFIRVGNVDGMQAMAQADGSA